MLDIEVTNLLVCENYRNGFYRMLETKAEIFRRLIDRLQHHIIEFSTPRNSRIFIRINREALKEVIEILLNEGFSHLLAITALNVEKGVEILYHFSGKSILVTLRVILPQDNYTIPTITDIIPGAMLHEREVHDLFGVKFKGSQDLRLLILPEDWPEGTHPMQKRK